MNVNKGCQAECSARIKTLSSHSGLNRALKKFYGRYHNIVDTYEFTVSKNLGYFWQFHIIFFHKFIFSCGGGSWLDVRFLPSWVLCFTYLLEVCVYDSFYYFFPFFPFFKTKYLFFLFENMWWVIVCMCET